MRASALFARAKFGMSCTGRYPTILTKTSSGHRPTRGPLRARAAALVAAPALFGFRTPKLNMPPAELGPPGFVGAMGAHLSMVAGSEARGGGKKLKG